MWVDLTVSVKQSEVPDHFLKCFSLVRPHSGSSLQSEIERLRPDVLLFDFDFPERPGLKLMERTKKEFARIPVIMMTVQHSESLAVWAFRARVWDYLVKPAHKREVERCLSGLSEVFVKLNRPGEPRLVHHKGSPVPQDNLVTPRNATPAELMPALAYIENNFRNKVTSAAVAKTCKMDTFRFSRAFSSVFGITFKEYLLRIRIKEACRLLEKPDIPVNEVAYLSGFNDPSYFSKVFKRYAGVLPSVYASSPNRRDIIGSDILSLILQ